MEKIIKKIKSRIVPIGIIAILVFFSVKTTQAEDENNTVTITKSLPQVETLDATNTSTSSVVLTGSVNPSGLPTTYLFKYQKDEYAQYSTGFVYAGKGNLNAKVSLPLKNLKPNTTYYYFMSATNKKGIATGTVLTFKTNNY